MKRIYHPWFKWECFRDGFYTPGPPPGMDDESCRIAYADFLADTDKFISYMSIVSDCWVHSCEHFLTNESMNRVAWLGQAAMCAATSVPCYYRGGFKLLTDSQQAAANKAAENHLRKWVHEYKTEGSKVRQGLEAPRLPKRNSGRSSTGAYEARVGPFIQGDMFGFA